jgi:D-arabinose 1-dehydrogenase-like Zn-dependent alcohol dehydrogenase
MVPGHEIVGIMTKVGAKVSRYKLGESGERLFS